MRPDVLGRALLGLMFLGAAGSAHADWMRDYDRGVRAFEDGNWREAESLMRSAMADRPSSSDRQRFQGTVFKPYMPHHYAGVAAWRQGDCQRAMDYWSNSSNQSALAKVDDLRAQQRSGMDTCRTQLAQASKPDTPTASTGTKDPSSTSTGSTTPPKQPATTTGTPSTTQTKPAVTTPKPPPTPPVQPPPAATSGPAPAALRNLVDQFIRGRYGDVVRSNPAGLPDAKARAHGFLLRAAAAFTQAELEGRSGSALDQARSDVRAAKAAQSNLRPDSGLFSPRFRAFYSETR